ncbi:hypothetical protein [Bacillus infantis]|uniref:hypothetical protein n=1 Tax=Bacillus infantis TaxID=324767 RepID=UPI0020A1EDB0|nr:hypothetical protein [Bacillus infantis]MCP1159461.1 hypothetical protein [Bacillus infantis]
MFEYNNPIISMRRKGTADDPFVPYEESLQVVNGKVALTEKPNKFQKVEVSGDSITWYETDGAIKEVNWYSVDYNLGVVLFHASHNGKLLNFNYLGEGSSYFPVDRVYTASKDGNVTETLGDIIKSGTGAIESLKEVNTIIDNANTAIENANSAATTAEEKASLVENNLAAITDSEQVRITNETDRINSEETRESNETSRIIKENQRIENEIERQNNENIRQENTQTAITNANAATEAANTSATNAQSLVDSSVHLREYSSTTNYIKNNQVRHNGSTWRCMKNCIGVTPTEGEYWTLLAQRGIDGTGSVSSVGGISPDDNGNVPLVASDFGALSPSDIGINVAGFNEQGQVLDKNGNVVEGKVKSVNGVSPDVDGNISIDIPDTSTFATQSELSDVDDKTALLTEDIQAADGKIDNHINDFMPHDSGLSEFASNPDVNGVYTTVNFKRSDGTLYLKSTLSNPNGNGNYQTVNWKFYSTDGFNEALVVNWTITYDESGVIMKKEVS